jgi:Ca-activated chloride channel homolog
MRPVASAALIALILEATSAKAAALALVLAIDVSASVTPDSYLLQRDGIARAFASPRLAEAISAMPGGIEALVLEWSDPDSIAVTVDWTRVADASSADRYAAAVRATRRSSAGTTAIGPALLAAAAAFDRLPEPAERRVIDISGDGIANFGLPPAAARDRIVAGGIAINGLAIETEELWLAGYYRNNVIGGPSAFVVIARTFEDFASAMLQKLLQEIADASVSAAPLRSAQMQ